jgi:hypothetical protein
MPFNRFITIQMHMATFYENDILPFFVGFHNFFASFFYSREKLEDGGLIEFKYLMIRASRVILCVKMAYFHSE